MGRMVDRISEKGRSMNLTFLAGKLRQRGRKKRPKGIGGTKFEASSFGRPSLRLSSWPVSPFTRSISE